MRAPRPLARWLARDPQGRTLAAAVPRGAGWVARSLVGETWRWVQGGHAALFATFWSNTLTALAPPRAADGWQVEHESEPRFVDEPVRLRSGAAKLVHRPTQAGWNEIPIPGTTSRVALHVQPAGALAELRAEQRRSITARAVGAAPASAPVAELLNDAPARAEYFAFVAFLIGAAVLWIEQRRAGVARVS